MITDPIGTMSQNTANYIGLIMIGIFVAFSLYGAFVFLFAKSEPWMGVTGWKPPKEKCVVEKEED